MGGQAQLIQGLLDYDPQGRYQVQQAGIARTQADTQLAQQQAQGVQLENARRQIENQDMGILGDAFRATNWDPDKAIPLAMQNGLSPMGYFKYQTDQNNMILSRAQLGEANIKLDQARNSQIGPILESVKETPVEQRTPDFLTQNYNRIHQINPNSTVTMADLADNNALDRHIGIVGYQGYLNEQALKKAQTQKEQAEGGRATAETTKANVETQTARDAQTYREFSTIPRDAQGNIADPAAYQGFVQRHPELNAPAMPTSQWVDQYDLAQVPADKRQEFIKQRFENRAMQGMTDDNLGQMVARVINPKTNPTEYATTVGAAKNALLSGLGSAGVNAAIKDGADRLQNRQNVIMERQISMAPVMAMQQQREWDTSYDRNNGELTKLETPVNNAMTDYARLKTMLQNPNKMSDPIAVQEYEKFMTGINRMSPQMINRIFGSKSALDTAITSVRKLFTGETLDAGMRQDMLNNVNQAGALLQQKQQLFNQAHNSLSGAANSSGHRQILNQVHQGLQAIDQQALGQTAGTTAPGGGGVPVVHWTRDAQGNPIPAP